MPARSPAAATSVGRAAEVIGTSWFTDTVRCNGFGNHGSDAASPFRSSRLSAQALSRVVAALGAGVSVIFPGLMIGIDQRIVAERLKSFWRSDQWRAAVGR